MDSRLAKVCSDGRWFERKLRHWPPGTIQNTDRAAFFLKRGIPYVSLPEVQPAQRSNPLLEYPARTYQSPKTILIAFAVLLFCIAALAAIPFLRVQKLRLLILRNQIEIAAAPGEPVLIDDWFLNRALRWKGSPALQHQLVCTSDGKLPAQMLSSQQEIVAVVAEGDPLLSDLQTHGFTLAPNASQAAWVAAGKGLHTPGRRVFRIYFAIPSNVPTSPPEAKP